MNSLLYALCNTKIIAPILYISGACTFPPLAYQEKVELQNSSDTLIIPVTAPIEHDYLIELTLIVPEGNRPQVEKLMGTEHTTCTIKFTSNEKLKSPAGATPFHITVKNSNGEITQNFYVSGNCGISWWAGNSVSRTITLVHLTKGPHTIEIKSLSSREIALTFPAHISITAGNKK